MAIAALITWLVTAGFGFWMLLVWASRGGVRRGPDSRETHLPAARVYSHFLLALVGLIIWIAYLVTDSSVLAWIAFADLVLIVILGSVLVARWSKDRRGVGAPGSPPRTASPPQLAEQSIPVAAVAMHGVFASATFVLVLLTAAGVGT